MTHRTLAPLSDSAASPSARPRWLWLLVALLCWCITPLAQASWNASWTKRVRITLNTAADGVELKAGADAVPVLVRLHTGNFPFVDAKPDGSDLRFVAADDKTALKYHVEKFDGINELALVWVQVPKLAPGNKADFVWLYYGNPAAPSGEDAKSTYDAPQALVYHFDDKAPLPQDSTANANHSERSTAKPSVAGLIGAAASFDGNAEVVVGAKPSLNAGAAGLTVSFWFKPVDVADAVLYAGPATNGIRIFSRGGRLGAQAGALSIAPTADVAAATWQHVALVVKDGAVLYVNGVEAGRVAGAPGELSAAGVLGGGFKGEIDEFGIATVARSADWVKAVAKSQGQEQKLLSYGVAEGEGGEGSTSYLKILLGAVTLDGWVVIGILMVMFVISLWVMASKVMFVNQAARENQKFMQHFDSLINSINPEEQGHETAAQFPQSPLNRLYVSGVTELRSRFEQYRAKGRPLSLTPQTLGAIRATVEARLVRELQRLNSKMVLLTIAIAGGPFLGLLGTVVGVMITFAAIAAAGDVNVNAIAPGIAAALVATVAGLAVAIPALFAYNYLTGRIGELTSDMQVFVDEFTTRIAENHSD